MEGVSSGEIILAGMQSGSEKVIRCCKLLHQAKVPTCIFVRAFAEVIMIQNYESMKVGAGKNSR